MFKILTILAFFALIFGLVAPQQVSKLIKREVTRKQIGIWLGGILFLFALLGSQFEPFPTEPTTTTSPSPTATQAPTATATPIAVVFNLATAKGKTPQQMYTLLGEPTSKDEEPTATQKELIAQGSAWEMIDTWEKQDQTLLMTYDYSSKIVTDFFITCKESSTNACTNTEETISHLKALLNADASGMRVEAVKQAKDKTKITGIKLLP